MPEDEPNGGTQEGLDIKVTNLVIYCLQLITAINIVAINRTKLVVAGEPSSSSFSSSFRGSESQLRHLPATGFHFF